MTFVRAFVIWILIIAAETIHGIARTLFLQPWTGDFLARQIAVGTGSILILTITYLCIDWIAARTKRELTLVGVLWVVLTITFEVILGRLVFGYSWERIAADYNLAQGGLLGIGMLVLLFAPRIAASFRRVRATPAERAAAMPGDDVIAAPAGSATHAITIQTPLQEVWPWLIQMGANRAGWYSYDFIDNGGQRSAEQIVPDFQSISPGILMAAHPEADDAFFVRQFETQRFLVLGTAPQNGTVMVTWAFVLKNAGARSTRLITRARINNGHRLYGLPVRVMKWIHFIIQRKQLLGVARRAERS